MTIAFSKYEGLGNDFIVIDDRQVKLEEAERLAPSLCDRHRGVGADGILLVGVRGASPRMRVINADGSRPQMCGNGLRCVALHIVRAGLADGAMTVETDAGPHPVEVLKDGRVSVSMVPASFAPGELPVIADAPLIDAPFEVGGRTLAVTAVSMGNPHAVIFDTLGDDRWSLGPALGADARFPQGVNVGFAQRTGPQAFELHVLERGVGWTQACGTGACAAAAAAVTTKRAQEGHPIAITLPGGRLDITIGPPGQRIIMTGPARHVFEGQLDLALDEVRQQRAR